MSRKTRTTSSIGALAGAVLLFTACATDNARTVEPPGLHPAVIEITKTEHPTVFIGEGRLSHEPEYVELAVTIQSECYPTPMEASAAADDAAASVMKTLRGILDPDEPRDGVFSKGGYTRGFERYVDSHRTVCRGTYAKTVTLTAKTSRIADVQARFSKLQHDLLSGSLKRSPSAAGGVTYSTLSEPQPRLYHETREQLEQQALADALRNARDKLEATAEVGCGSDEYDILRMVETGVDAGRPIAYARSTPAAGGETMELDAIWINKLLEVSFVAPGRCTRSVSES